MDDQTSRTPPKGRAGGGETVRFEATLYRGERQRELKDIATLDLDRIPGPDGEIRVLLTIDEAARLVLRGYEVHLLKAHPVRPLDGALVPSDEEAERLLEQAVRGLERQEGS